MIDRKKVIEGLELCTAEIPPDGSMHQYDFCIKCPYHDPVFIYCFNKNALMKDALEVIKEQEPVEPKKIPHSITYPGSTYICGNCKIEILEPDDNFCPYCGRAVKWDD